MSLSNSKNIDSNFSRNTNFSENKWYVLFTKPRHEFRVKNTLQLMGVLTFCPYVIKISQWSDRKKKIKSPVLTSMILVYLKEAERNKVFDCPGVLRYMFFNKKVVTVPQDDINILKNQLEGKNCFDASVSNLIVGQELKIDRFQNKIGEIVNISSNRVWVKIKSLNIKVRLDLV